MIPNRKAALVGVFVCLLARSFAQPGTITTFAGGYPEGIPGPALQAALVNPARLAEDAAGNIYIMGWAYIYKLTPDGRVTIAAGTGVRANSADGGTATSTRINPGGANWASLLVDGQGNVIFTDSGSHRIRKIEPTTGLLTTIAGNGTSGYSGDTGPGPAAQLASPYGLAKDSLGNIYFGDSANHRVRKITPGGTITTVAGDGNPGYRGDGAPATQASLNQPIDLAIDSADNIFILDYNNSVVRKVTPAGIISTAVTAAASPISVSWAASGALAIDKANNLYISAASRVFKMEPSGRVTVVFGNGQATINEYQGPALQANVGQPRGLLVDSKGNLVMGFLLLNGRVGRVDTAGNFSWIAGVSSIAGANGPPAFARIYLPGALAFDPGGTLYADEFTVGVMKLTPSAVTRLSVNVGSFGFQAMVFDSAGNLYRSDANTDTIRKIDTAGNISIFAGRPSVFPSEGSFGGDGGPATEALFYNPRGVAFGPDGSFYVTDSLNNRIRKIAPDGIISTVAGTGTAGFSGDGAAATAAVLNNPSYIAVDSAGSLYIADIGNSRVRRITSDGVISTYAGNGNAATIVGSGDGGPANQARIGAPRGLAVDAASNLYILDAINRVRKVTSGGIISTIAGNGNPGFSGDGGPAVNATLNVPQGIAIDVNGNIYIGDSENHRIRKIASASPFTATPSALLFASTLNGASKSQLVTVATTDGAPRRFQVRSNVPWLSVAPDSGTVDAGTFGKVIVTANPTGRAKGTFPGLITIVDLDSGAATAVPVTLTVSGTAQQLRLSQVGLTFTAVQGGAAPPSQSFQVVNAGVGAMPWTQTSATLAGGPGWLSVTPASGTSTAGAAPPAIVVSVNPTGLPAGAYYGQVNVAAPGADNSPQTAIVLLRILPTDGTPGPSLDPSGLLYTATPTANPPAQSFTLSNSSTRSINYTVALRFTSGTGWLTAPAAGSLTGGQSRTLDLQARSTTLAAGVYRATITFTFTPDNVTRVLDIALVVNPAAPSADAPSTRNADPACTAKQLVAVIRRPGASYQTAAGWPVPMEAAVVDDCGTPMTTGRVVASFSSNDPAVPLQHSASGLWQATWASRTTGTAGNVTIRLAAESIDQTLAGTAQVIIRSDLNPDQPSINPGGVLNAASFSSSTPVPVGGYVSVFGSRLSKEFQLATSLPLPSSLGETSVFLGGRLAPLHFASDGQVNAILPYSVADNTTHQMIVRRGNIPSLPEPVLVASVQPAVFSYDGSGKGQGHIYVARADGTFLADAAHPVKPGDVILFYATGLGPVNPPVVEGRPAPADPLSLPVNPITVSIQGKDARVVFAGLAPGFAGVYQVNAVAPDGLTADPSAPLVVSSGSQPSPSVTMAVTN